MPYQPISHNSGDHHVLIEEGNISHEVPDSNNQKWSHVNDLDTFFKQVYRYHDRQGFRCIVVYNIGKLALYAFMVIFTTILYCDIDYDVLFAKEETNGHEPAKPHIADIFLPWSEARKNIGFGIGMLLFLASCYFVYKVYKSVEEYFSYKLIREFYNDALNISDEELPIISWKVVEERLIVAQKSHKMSITNDDITELDIYHRILRYENYFIAMVDKRVIPFKFKLPLVGEVCFLSRGMKKHLDFLFFTSPWSPFRNSWELNPDYLLTNRKHEVVRDLNSKIRQLALASFLCFPIVAVWQVLHAFCSYADFVRRERGGVLAKRVWSLYGQAYLRHFNELKHDLRQRLNKSYKPSVKYLESYSSPLLTIVSRICISIFGTIACVITLFTVIDADVFRVEHLITVWGVFTAISVLMASTLVEENLYVTPERILTEVIKTAHYLPDQWAQRANSVEVRKEFSQLLQLRVCRIIEDIVSPIVTPFILFMYVAPRAPEIAEFFRHFTVRLAHVGDICAFAQMNVRKHGNIMYQPRSVSSLDDSMDGSMVGGKTELSLIRFSSQHPKWKPPNDSVPFLQTINSMVEQQQQMYVPEPSESFASSRITNQFPQRSHHDIYQGPMDQTFNSQQSMTTFNSQYPYAASQASEIFFPNPRDVYKMHDDNGNALERSLMVLHNIRDDNTSFSEV